MSNALRALLLAQAIYYLITGIWPILSMRTFEAVTGPKTDKWLVKTVGVLVIAVAAPVLYDATVGRVAVETAIVAAGSALALGAVDVIYAGKRTIRPVYLADAVVQAVLILCWAFAWARGFH